MIVAVALALGAGTMVGWRRVVLTVGEKIGKQGMTYAQGMSAQVTAMGAIGLANVFSLPVSTTHVLSSGIAGTMIANKSGLQGGTVRNILLAWVLTLPRCCRPPACSGSACASQARGRVDHPRGRRSLATAPGYSAAASA